MRGAVDTCHAEVKDGAVRILTVRGLFASGDPDARRTARPTSTVVVALDAQLRRRVELRTI